MIQQDRSAIRASEEQVAEFGENELQQEREAACPPKTAFRPLTRIELRNLWLKEYGAQDVALQIWVQLVEQQHLEIDMMLQMHGLLVFGTMVSSQEYTQFYLDLNEELYRESDSETADILRSYHTALVPPTARPEIGPEGLPTLLQYLHLRDVVIMNAGHNIQLPFWRGKIRAVDAFVMGAKTTE